MSVNSKITQLMNKVPGKKRFGIYRFLPFYFVLGGAMEWFMINVSVGNQTFYDVYRRKQTEQYYQKLEEK
ncbi:small integral membrane protein 4 [Protobothrops mucrosquamatus]|uniref:small integral membrane protein 4 n=1 Tax=Protobothrops mucrosquamatus TaxID=103944 RepID=UPI000775A612|nr:small integral membrane protein 4 [Protobothrops mucrosquamatus]XP_015671341.1 small integral membrane protein 4 [Protobothrops mucrosquamatus]